MTIYSPANPFCHNIWVLERSGESGIWARTGPDSHESGPNLMDPKRGSVSCKRMSMAITGRPYKWYSDLQKDASCASLPVHSGTGLSPGCGWVVHRTRLKRWGSSTYEPRSQTLTQIVCRVLHQTHLTSLLTNQCKGWADRDLTVTAQHRTVLAKQLQHSFSDCTHALLESSKPNWQNSGFSTEVTLQEHGRKNSDPTLWTTRSYVSCEAINHNLIWGYSATNLVWFHRCLYTRDTRSASAAPCLVQFAGYEPVGEKSATSTDIGNTTRLISSQQSTIERWWMCVGAGMQYHQEITTQKKILLPSNTHGRPRFAWTSFRPIHFQGTHMGNNDETTRKSETDII